MAGSQLVQTARTARNAVPSTLRTVTQVQQRRGVIDPTAFAKMSRSSKDWDDAKSRVISSYREWIRAAPEIQSMYSLSITPSEIRTKIRQEYERHRFVAQLPIVDVLLQQSHAEFQETLNYWKQVGHVLKYFRIEEDEKARLPKGGWMGAFLEGRNT